MGLKGARWLPDLAFNEKGILLDSAIRKSILKFQLCCGPFSQAFKSHTHGWRLNAKIHMSSGPAYFQIPIPVVRVLALAGNGCLFHLQISIYVIRKIREIRELKQQIRVWGYIGKHSALWTEKGG